MAEKLLTTDEQVREASDSPAPIGTAPTGQWFFLGALVIGLGGLMVWLSWPRTDYKAALDEQITERWMPGREVVDALDFFKQGGVYENRDPEAEIDIDREYVIPLLQRLKDEFHLNALAIVEPPPPQAPGSEELPKIAMAVVVEAPQDRETRNKVRAAILETADEFPGFAMQNWSHNYVALDFLDEQETTPLIQAGALEPLKASQRIME
jgi:hypothetical protein